MLVARCRDVTIKILGVTYVENVASSDFDYAGCWFAASRPDPDQVIMIFIHSFYI